METRGWEAEIYHPDSLFRLVRDSPIESQADVLETAWVPLLNDRAQVANQS